MIFDGGDTTAITTEVNVDVDSLDIQSGYVSTFTVGANFSITTHVATAGAVSLTIGDVGTANVVNFNANNVGTSLTIAGDVVMDTAGTVSMGPGTWTVSGSFDNANVTTFNRNTSTLVMNGTSKNLTSSGAATRLYNLTIALNATITSTHVNYSQINGTLTVSGTYTIANLEAVEALYDVKVTGTGIITGSGTLTIYNSTGKITQQDGIIDVNTLNIRGDHAAAPIVPATYKSATVSISNTIASAYSWTLSATPTVPYTFEGNVTFNNTNAGGSYTIDNATNNPSIVFEGNVTFTQSAGTFTWTKGTGTITAGGTAAQSLNFLGKTVEDLNITNTGGTVSLLTSAVTTDSLTVASNATFDLAGNNMLYSAAANTTNNGTIKLRGGETLTNVNNLDTDSGLVEYYGAGATTYDLPNYGATDFHDLTINSTAGTDTFRSPASFGIGGNFTLTSGTLKNDTNNSNISIAGDVTTAAAPTWTKGTGTITLNGTVAQSIDFHDKSVEDLVISNTADIVTLADGVTTDSLTVDTGASFDLASQPFGFTAASSPTNSGTIYMRGDEVLTNVNDLDTTAGTVVIDGAIAYVSLPNYSYYDLVFTGTGSWLLTNPLSVANDLTVVTGTINAGGGTIYLAGNFNHLGGTFTADTGTVNFSGTNQIITGDTTFYNLTKSITTANTLFFEAGKTQTVTGTLTLNGASGQLLSLRSTADGTQWNLHLTGTPRVSYVDVKDSNLTGNSIEPSDSVNSGNNSSLWIWPSPTPTPDYTNGSTTATEEGYYAYNKVKGTIETGKEETSEEAVGQITDKEKETKHGLAWYWWLLIIVSATTIVIVVWRVVATKKNTSFRHEK